MKQVSVPVFSFKKAWHFKTEEDARQFIKQAKATGRRYDEDIEEGRKKTGRSVDEVKPIFDKISEKYNHAAPIKVVSLSGLSDIDLFRELLPNTSLDGVSEEEIHEAAERLREYFKETGAYHDPETNRIIIFADVLYSGLEENTFFHENIHAILHQWYGDSPRAIAERFWNNTPDKVGNRTKEFVKSKYPEEKRQEEWFVRCLADAMESGDIDGLVEYLKSDATDIERVDNILNYFGYEREKEKSERKERKKGEPTFGGSREASQKSIRGKGRIAKHIDNLLEQLGTKERTTVYHSFDDLPERDKKFIREAEKRGRKVRGWYANGHIYLYLPHIDSTYQAEQTIWHETVAHHGLRELIGAENYNDLLKRLWLEYKDGDMGKWVTERMQTNGWSLSEAIDEYLAREAEKNPFKQPGLWQRLQWWLSDILHKMGFQRNHKEKVLRMKACFQIFKAFSLYDGLAPSVLGSTQSTPFALSFICHIPAPVAS